MDPTGAERLAAIADPQAVPALRARPSDAAAARAAAEQFGTLLMQRLMQNGDGEALAMAGGTGGDIVNSMFARTIAQTAMSGDKLGLADLLFRSIMAKQAPPAPAGAGSGTAGAPQSAPLSAAPSPAGRGFSLAPYWQGQGLRPLGGGTAGGPIEPPGSPVAGLIARPAATGGTIAAGAAGPTCPLPAAGPTDPVIPVAGAPLASADGLAAQPPAGIAAFARRIGPALRRAAARLGVSPRVLLAQAALESGWGRSMVGNNLFGIKAGPSWPQAQVSAATHEVLDGRLMPERASFRAYGSLDAAIEDYVALIAGSPRYRAALGHGDDAQGYGEALIRGGYASDGAYPQKLAAVAASPAVGAAMAQIDGGGRPLPAGSEG